MLNILWQPSKELARLAECCHILVRTPEVQPGAQWPDMLYCSQRWALGHMVCACPFTPLRNLPCHDFVYLEVADAGETCQVHACLSLSPVICSQKSHENFASE